MEKNKKNTLIIATMFCCGKTYLYKHNNTKYTMIDLDEELETKRENGKIQYLTNKNYIPKIQDLVGIYDFILVSVKPYVLGGLEREKIPYVLVYPEQTRECYLEWERRNEERGTDFLWKACKYHWNYLLKRLQKDPYAIKHYHLSENKYLSDIIDQIYSDQNKDKGDETC